MANTTETTSENRYQKLTNEQKNRYYGAQRNERRRQEYAQNDEYRQAVLQRNREAYIKRRGGVLHKEEPSSKMLANRLEEVLVRHKEQGPIIGTYSVIKRPALSEAMKVSTTTMMRWLKNDMFPAPELYAVLDEESGRIDKRVMYYTEDEAKALFKVYKKHIGEFLQYSEQHTETRDAFKKAVAEVRKHWKK